MLNNQFVGVRLPRVLLDELLNKSGLPASKAVRLAIEQFVKQNGKADVKQISYLHGPDDTCPQCSMPMHKCPCCTK